MLRSTATLKPPSSSSDTRNKPILSTTTPANAKSLLKAKTVPPTSPTKSSIKPPTSAAKVVADKKTAPTPPSKTNSSAELPSRSLNGSKPRAAFGSTTPASPLSSARSTPSSLVPSISKLSKTGSLISLDSASSKSSSRPGTSSSTSTPAKSWSNPASARTSIVSKAGAKTSVAIKSDGSNDKAEHVEGGVNLALVVSKNGVNLDMTREENLSRLANATHMRLDRSNLTTLLGIASWPSITHLHVQHNALTSLELVSQLPQLRILSVASNQLRTLEGIAGLQFLKLVDAESNLIDTIQADWFPPSLENLQMSGNPCSTAPDHRLNLVYACKQLAILDNIEISAQETRLATLALGTDEEKMCVIQRANDPDDDFDEEGIESADVSSKTEIATANTSSPAQQTRGLEEKNTYEIPLEPFTQTVDAIIERSKARQIENVAESRRRMEELIAQLRDSGKARVDRLKEIISSI
ncbi:hypothetical protein HDU81_009903 [Chytriomyces hyalinus]|nr:hypothetical protein HDU81_009903 [Chytriomyces hyalinus]